MSTIQDSEEELGSLSQSARLESLRAARVTLFVLGFLHLGTAVLLYSVSDFTADIFLKEQMDEVKQILGPDGKIDESIIYKQRQSIYPLIYITSIIISCMSGAFLFLGCLVYKFPIASTTIALVFYVGITLIGIISDPAMACRGMFLNITILVFLWRGVRAAFEYERHNRELAKAKKRRKPKRFNEDDALQDEDDFQNNEI